MRYAYHLARAHASAIRAGYGRLAPTLSAPRSPKELPRQVVTFSSGADVAEQLASLRSLLRHVGLPPSITVVSDGSHTDAQQQAIRALHPCVDVVVWSDFAAPDLPNWAWSYAQSHPMGKKLIALMSLPKLPTLYADSDVLFFCAAQARKEFYDTSSYYLPDLAGGLKAEVLGESNFPPANAGFFMTDGDLPLAETAEERAPRDDSEFHVYTEQSLVHLALHRSDAHRLDPLVFHLGTGDHFRYRDEVTRRATALRHYIGMIRYKFWLAVGRTSTLW